MEEEEVPALENLHALMVAAVGTSFAAENVCPSFHPSVAFAAVEASFETFVVEDAQGVRPSALAFPPFVAAYPVASFVGHTDCSSVAVSAVLGPPFPSAAA